MNKKNIILLATFLCLELVCYVIILSTAGTINIVFSYTSVFLAFLYSLLFCKMGRSAWLTEIALLATCFSDLFLVVIQPRMQVVAMIFFSITQIMYFLRLFFEETNKTKCNVLFIIRVILVVLVLLVTTIVLKDKTDALSLISMFYFTNLTLNVVIGFIEIKTSKLFAFGMLCFLICDIFIGLQVAIGAYIMVPETSIIYKIVFAPFNIAWLFYVPSQVLLALSIWESNK